MNQGVQTYDEAVKRGHFEDDSKKTVVLVGNPNVGKSVIFGFLTRRYVTVSNYPGTTVELTVGEARLPDLEARIVDSPGVNSFIPSSEDERVTRDLIIHGRTDRILQVADAKNMKRTLLLALELIEMGLPFTLNLNMMDEALNKGIRIDTERLEKILGIDVIPTVAVRRKGLRKLARSLSKQKRSEFGFNYSSEVEQAISECVRYLPDTKVTKRALAVMLLSGDGSLWNWLGEHVSSEAVVSVRMAMRKLEESFNRAVPSVIVEQRMRVVEWIVKQVTSGHRSKAGALSGRFSALTIHPVWGIPVLAAVLFLMYQVVGRFGAGFLVDLIEGSLFGRYVNPWSASVVDLLFSGWLPAGAYDIIRDVLVGEYGLITMALTYSIAIILPIVGMFFLVFGILEDSGYLPRVAVMLNRLFRLMGLNGKAVLPMILGLGCDTMATITTRILESKKERLITTLLLALGVPCSAQLGVILGILSGISIWATVIWVFVVTGVIFLVGFLAAKLLGGKGSDFILELPPLRFPRLSNIAIKTVARVEWYLKEAVPLFILGTLILFGLHKSGALVSIYDISAPLVTGFLGLPVETTEAFIVGFLRRDYGTAGLYSLAEKGLLDPIGIVVGIVTITLFVPCVANFLIMIKERGFVTTLYMVLFIVPFAFLVGGVLNFTLRVVGAVF